MLNSVPGRACAEDSGIFWGTSGGPLWDILGPLRDLWVRELWGGLYPGAPWQRPGGTPAAPWQHPGSALATPQKHPGNALALPGSTPAAPQWHRSAQGC